MTNSLDRKFLIVCMTKGILVPLLSVRSSFLPFRDLDPGVKGEEYYSEGISLRGKR